jgi:hypothetical protein
VDYKRFLADLLMVDLDYARRTRPDENGFMATQDEVNFFCCTALDCLYPALLPPSLSRPFRVLPTPSSASKQSTTWDNPETLQCSFVI